MQDRRCGAIISWQGQFGPDNTGRMMLNLISRQSGGDAPAEAETA
ncbi:MAG TPA: hypothetical protein VMC83_12100 [Streptosporangiaceae bacterium]|nr:hypothetical protein [Streptosporangiaceae bacterium]